MSDLCPHFRDIFLDRACRAFEKRRKAISYHGRLSFDSDPSSSAEWATLVYSSFNHPSLILELTEGHRGNFYIRSNQPKSRGKVLFRLEDLRLLDTPSRLVETFEWTISRSRRIEEDAESAPIVLDSILQRWKSLAVRIVK
jgi:hypothetical protein